MNFQHYDIGRLNGGETVEVTLSGTEANVKLLDDGNFRSYERGQAHRYFGGHYKRTPVLLRVPTTGHWHVAVDLGGFAGTVNTGVRVIRG